MDGAGKPVCLGGGESVTAGRVFLSAHGGKAFVLRRAGVPFGKTAMGFSLTLRRELIAQRAHTLCGGEEKNSGDICGAQLKGTEMWRGRRSGGGGCSFRRMAEKPFLRRAGVPFGKTAAMRFALTLRRGGESVRQAVLCGSPNSARRAGAAVYAPKPQKRQRENKNPPLRGTVVRN